MKQLKKKNIRHICWKVLLSALFITIGASTIQSAHAADVKLGVLDEAKLSDEYTAFQEAMKAVDQRAQNLDVS